MRAKSKDNSCVRPQTPTETPSEFCEPNRSATASASSGSPRLHFAVTLFVCVLNIVSTQSTRQMATAAAAALSPSTPPNRHSQCFAPHESFIPVCCFVRLCHYSGTRARIPFFFLLSLSRGLFAVTLTVDGKLRHRGCERKTVNQNERARERERERKVSFFNLYND